MTKASDNAFPSVLVTEGTEPSAPAAGKQRLYIDSTSHHLMRVPSSGTEVDIETAAAGGMATDALWDAAGDLAVGTGANTAAKLTIGAAGGAVSRVNGAVDWNSGTGFPTAATGDRYWRTDLRMEFFYDGTRWLSTALFEHFLGQMTGITATSAEVYTAVRPDAADMWLEDLITAMNAASGLSGSAYWTVECYSYDDASGSLRASTNNTSLTNAQWYRRATAIDALLGSSVDAFSVRAVKTSTPGAFTGGAMVTYRIVGA